MKTLYVIRHAKSSWDDSDQADFDRPLNERGKRDAPRMGKRLSEKRIHPDLMLSSPAKRALTTCTVMADALGYAHEKIKTDRELYHASENDILRVIKNVKDDNDVLIIFGHNPGLTDFANELLNKDADFIENIPTCGVVAIELPVTSWKDISRGTGKLVFFDYPKNLEA